MKVNECHVRNLAVVKELFHMINVMGNDTDLALAISDHLKKEHRTLQGSFWRMIKTTAGEYYEQNKDFTDPRNQVAVALAKDIEDSNNFPPFI